MVLVAGLALVRSLDWFTAAKGVPVWAFADAARGPSVFAATDHGARRRS